LFFSFFFYSEEDEEDEEEDDDEEDELDLDFFLSFYLFEVFDVFFFKF
jgi:hypothetical protein